MVLTDAEINAELDRVNEALAAHEKHEKDFEIKALSSLLKMARNSTVNEGEILKDLIAELRSINEAKAVNVEDVKDLTKRLRNAIAEKEASSSK